jgi:Ca2+-binding EF-hand superfamily protein
MKSRVLTGAILVVAGLAAASAVVADQRGAFGGQRGEGRMQAMTFADLDTDGDGLFTPADIEGRADARFSALDADGDGSVSRDEFLAHSAARASERAGDMFDRLDADGDGVLSRDAIAALGGPGQGVERMISRFDADGDGALSAEEFETAQARFLGRGGFGGGHQGRGNN